MACVARWAAGRSPAAPPPRSSVEYASPMNIRAAACAVALLLLIVVPARGETASADDTARFLAGLEPPAASPLTPLTSDRRWLSHKKHFDSVFAQFDKRHLAKIRAWSAANLTTRRPVMFYMFSGPDFLHADAFFPEATTYVMAGLEPVGQIPVADLRPASVAQLRGLGTALRSMLGFSFFITRDMRAQFRGGTLPILYVLLARSHKTIQEVSLIALNDRGEIQPDGASRAKTDVRGAQIVFSDADGRKKTLYYFSVDLSNSGVKRNGILKFAGQLGEGDSLIKSASYLLHSDGFSTVRSFLLDHSASIVQDDSGVPVRYFNEANWQLRPFGHYLHPISIFARYRQPKLSDVFRKERAVPIDFGIGYTWRPRQSNLLVAQSRRANGARTGGQ